MAEHPPPDEPAEPPSREHDEPARAEPAEPAERAASLRHGEHDEPAEPAEPAERPAGARAEPAEPAERAASLRHGEHDEPAERPARARDEPTDTPPAPSARPSCPICWTPFTPIGRQIYCTEPCRKTAWRRRQATTCPTPQTLTPQAIRPRDATVYACPNCQRRYHAQPWCPTCRTPATSLGLGGPCPHCHQPVAVNDLLDTHRSPTNR